MNQEFLLESTERYVNKEMSSEEQVMFEKFVNNDAAHKKFVLEHIQFLQSLNQYASVKNFKSNIKKVEDVLRKEGFIESNPRKIFQLTIQNFWNKNKKTVTVAASIAGIVSVLIAGALSVTKNSSEQINPLVEKLTAQEVKTNNIEKKLNQIVASNKTTPINATFRATGFIIDNENNLLATNTHVIHEAKNELIVEDNNGNQYKAEPIYVNEKSDLAIIQIVDKSYKKLPALPYGFVLKTADIGENIFTLGYPKNEVVYNEGYVSAKNGYNLDSLYCQLSTSASAGNSGSPVLTNSGKVVGIIASSFSNQKEVVYAIKTQNIINALDQLKTEGKIDKSTSLQSKKSNLKGLSRPEQVKKITPYVFMVKGN